MDSTTQIDLISIPLLVGLIGYLTNWTGAAMLLHPLRFRGVHLPGLRSLLARFPGLSRWAPLLHRSGALGWQGLVPARAAAMAAVVARLIEPAGGPPAGRLAGDLDADRLAVALLEAARPEMRGLVERVGRSEDPRLWQQLTPTMREVVHGQVDSCSAQTAARLAAALQAGGAQLVDPAALLKQHLTTHPEDLTALLARIGRREFRSLQNFGFYLGVPMGFVVFGILQLYPHRWVVPVGAALTGGLASYLGLLLLLAPVDASRAAFGRQGLLIRRHAELAAALAAVVHRVLDPADVGTQLLRGRQREHTLALVESALRPTVAQALTPARAAARVAIGTKEYQQARRWVATVPPAPLAPPGAETDGAGVKQLARRIEEHGPRGAAAFLRAGLARDSALLHAHGALLGVLAYLLYHHVIGGN
jgi:hypothetical protein